MEINELVELLLENRKMALFYVILLLSVVLITMLFLPGIIEKMKALINRRKSPGRISMEWDIVKNNSYTCQNEGFDYFYAGDYAEDNIGYDNPFIDEIQQEFMVSIPDELYNDDLNMNNLETEHQQWVMEESIKSVTPFEYGGYDMDNGNSFNDDYFTSSLDNSFDDFSNPDPFGF